MTDKLDLDLDDKTSDGDRNNACRAKDSTEARAWALEHDLIVRTPAANELFIDIDDVASMDTFHRNLGMVEDFIGILGWTIHKSRNKEHGRHIDVLLERDVTHLERLLLQACLGSDLRRELNSFEDIQRGDPFPTLFFEKSDYDQIPDVVKLSESDVTVDDLII